MHISAKCTQDNEGRLRLCVRWSMFPARGSRVSSMSTGAHASACIRATVRAHGQITAISTHALPSSTISLAPIPAAAAGFAACNTAWRTTVRIQAAGVARRQITAVSTSALSLPTPATEPAISETAVQSATCTFSGSAAEVSELVFTHGTLCDDCCRWDHRARLVILTVPREEAVLDSPGCLSVIGAWVKSNAYDQVASFARVICAFWAERTCSPSIARRPIRQAHSERADASDGKDLGECAMVAVRARELMYHGSTHRTRLVIVAGVEECLKTALTIRSARGRVENLVPRYGQHVAELDVVRRLTLCTRLGDPVASLFVGDAIVARRRSRHHDSGWTRRRGTHASLANGRASLGDGEEFLARDVMLGASACIHRETVDESQQSHSS